MLRSRVCRRTTAWKRDDTAPTVPLVAVFNSDAARPTYGACWFPTKASRVHRGSSLLQNVYAAPSPSFHVTLVSRRQFWGHSFEEPEIYISYHVFVRSCVLFENVALLFPLSSSEVC